MRLIALVAILLPSAFLAEHAHSAGTSPAAGAGLPARVFAAFLVNSANDVNDGVCNPAHCSLREAILAANASPGFDQIHFAIPGAGPHTIQPGSELPAVSGPVSIDGTTQPGYVSTPLIELNGQSIFTMLRISAGGSTVRGLAINRAGIGLSLETNGGNTVEACFFGTDVTGTIKAEPFNSNTGIEVSSPLNTIGGATPAQRNVISGQFRGISIGFSPGTRIIGNYIGTDVTGTVALGNTNGIRSDGVGLYTIGGTQPGDGNLISGNGYGIVVLGGDSSGVLVQGNFIGTDASGTAALGNDTEAILAGTGLTVGGTLPGARNVISGNGGGVDVVNRCRILGNYIGVDATGTNALGNSGPFGFGVRLSGNDNVVGGSEPGARNVISANTDGVLVQGFGATGNRIQGNYIGTDASGTLARGNSFGVKLVESGNLVGGTGPGEGNLISGNFCGVQLIVNVTGNRIEGNRIGTDASGAGPLGNSYGVLIESSPRNTIGGAASGAGNHIAWNFTAGVELRSSSTVGNLLQGNAIVDNSGGGIHLSLTGDQNRLRTNSIARNSGGLGIDLFPAGVTPNDATDLDSGSNGLQNFPVVAVAWTNGVTTHVEGSLQSIPDATYELEFFASPACDPSGHGEGELPLGLATVATPGTGLVPFSVDLPVAAAIGSWLTATATDAAGSTSEFSACITVVDAATPVALSMVRAVAREGEVRLEWYGAAATGLVAVVERWRASEGWRPIPPPVVADGEGRIVYVDHDVAPGTRYGYRLIYDEGGRRMESEAAWIETPAAAVFGLAGALQNPSRGALQVRFSLASDGPAELDLFDITGRRRLHHDMGSPGRGVHDVRLGTAAELGAGMYWIRLTQAGRTRVARVVVTP